MKKKLFLALLVMLIIIQFFPISTDNPSTVAEEELEAIIGSGYSEMSLIKDACYDCHSNDSKFPGYSRLQPVGWFLRSHIRGGRQKVNFSTWGKYSPKQQNHKLQECVEVIEENRMPMKSYTWLHPKSKLSQGDKDNLIAFFTKLQSS